MTDAYLNRIATAVPSVDMVRSGRVPSTITAGLPSCLNDILNGGGTENFFHQAVHPVGRTVLDAVEEGARLSKELLAQSCANMCSVGSMSSATVMFVLAGMMQPGTPPVAAAPWRSAPVLRSGPCSSKQRAGGS